MKKIFLIIVTIISSFIMTSCSFLLKKSLNDNEFCDQLITNVANYCIEGKKDELRKLFAPKLYTFPTFEEDLQKLVDYIDGDFEKVIGFPNSVGEYSNFDGEWKRYSMDYKIITSEDTYRLTTFYYKVDTRSKDNVGINKFSILKISEDEYPEESFIGKFNADMGLFVGEPHVLIRYQICVRMLKSLANFCFEKNIEEVIKMFAPKLYNDPKFEENIDLLINNLDSKTFCVLVTYDEEKSENDNRKTVYVMTSELCLKSDKSCFLYVEYISADIEAPENIGITTFYIVTYDKSFDLNKLYKDDFVPEEGIHIGYINESAIIK